MNKMNPVGLLKKFYRYYNKNRILFNVNNSSHKKNVLISYTTYPHRHKKSKKHTNIPESLAITSCFEKHGYNCDVINCNSNRVIDYDKYDIIFGFGTPFEGSFSSRKKLFKIYYGTGKHPYFSNQETLKRGLEAKRRRGEFLLESLRLVKDDYLLQTVAVDSLIVVGGESEISTYRKYTSLPIQSIYVSFFKIFDYLKIINRKDFTEAPKHFLFFSGGGMIHKGLDMLLEVFSKQKDIHLHICASVKAEPRFEKMYKKELYENENIHTYDFVDLESGLFEDLLTKCAFVILPSCSEGMSTSVINAIGNGGLIPILTEGALINADEQTIHVKELSIESIQESLQKIRAFTKGELIERSMKIGEFVNSNCSIDDYYHNFETILKKIIYEHDM